MPAPITHNSAERAAVPFIGRYPGAFAAIVVAILTITAILLVLAINRIQTTQLEADAIARGESWSSALISVLESVDQVFEGGQLSEKDRSTIALASRIGGLEKFIIFDAAGTAIAASEPADLGTVNRSPYWVDSVLRGRVHATIEHQASGEFGPTEADAAPTGDGIVVAETYVPVLPATAPAAGSSAPSRPIWTSPTAPAATHGSASMRLPPGLPSLPPLRRSP